jgi:Uma2 family endonuclease
MSTAAIDPATERVAATPAGVPYRISADEFYRMIDADVFAPDRRAYLWDGEIYEVRAKTVPHAVSFAKIEVTLVPRIPAGWCPWPENPITISGDRVPLPDFVIVRGTPDAYSRDNRRPAAAEAGLMIEIAPSGVRSDSTFKLEAYARAGVPAYWVVNLMARQVMLCMEPRSEAGIGIYGSIKAHGMGDAVPFILDGREVGRIPVGDMIGEEPAK